MLLQLAVLGSLSLHPGAPTSADTLSAAARLHPSSGSVTLVAHGERGMPPRFVGAREIQPLPVVGPLRADAARSPFSMSSGSDDPPQMIEYSDAYFTRLTIHKWASYLTLPLFVSEYVVGQKLMNGDGSLRGVHGALAGGIGALFAVNTVTGGWNAIEGWKDPEGRTRRTLHSALMLLADAGFFVTAALANETESEGGVVRSVNNSNHRRAAIASMSTAMLGYVIMLPIFGGS